MHHHFVYQPPVLSYKQPIYQINIEKLEILEYKKNNSKNDV